MIIEGAQIFTNNKAVTDGGVSSVIDLGKGGDAYAANWVDVKLTKGGGALTKVTLQTAADEAFSAPVEAAALSVPATVDQAAPAQLLQFRLPSGLNRYARLRYAGTGTVFAAVVTGVALG